MYLARLPDMREDGKLADRERRAFLESGRSRCVDNPFAEFPSADEHSLLADFGFLHRGHQTVASSIGIRSNDFLPRPKLEPKARLFQELRAPSIDW